MVRAYGEPNESGNISAASVRHEVCLVRFDRRHTDKKFGRDFLCRHFTTDHLQGRAGKWRRTVGKARRE